MKTKKIVALLAAAAVVISSFSIRSALAESTETNKWIQTSDNSFSYQVGAENMQAYGGWLNFLEYFKAINWSEVMYISVDVTVTGKAKPFMEFNTSSSSDSPVIENGDKKHLILKTDGANATSWSLNFNSYDAENNIAAAANSIITVDNVEFHTTYAGIKNNWYNSAEGSYCYEVGSEAITEYNAALNLSEAFPLPENTNWSEVKYVTADVAVSNGKACPVLEDTNLNIHGDSLTIENGKATLTFKTNGTELTAFQLGFWNCEGTSFQIAANSIVTVDNVHYYTDYNNLYDDWFSPVPNTYRYQVGNSPVTGYNAWLDLSAALPDGMDWSQVMYITADIVTSGKACPLLQGTTSSDEWIDGHNPIIDGQKTSLSIRTDGATLKQLGLNFRDYSDAKIQLDANSTVTLDNLVFHTSYEGIENQWYNPSDGTYCYIDTKDGAPPVAFDNPFFMSDDAIEVPCYVSVDVTIEGYVDGFLLKAYGENGSYRNGTEYNINKENATFPAYMYLYDGEYNQICINGWGFTDGVKITLSNFKILEGPIPENVYTTITGEWVQTGNTSYYYKAGAEGEESALSYLPKPEEYEWSDIQTITFEGYKVVNGVEGLNEGDATMVSLTIYAYNAALDTDMQFDNINFLEKENKNQRPIVKKVRGRLHDEISIRSWWANKGIEVYITDITYGIDPIQETEFGPNDVFVDDTTYSFLDETEVLQISGDALKAAVTTPGKLVLYMKSNSEGNATAECQFNDWNLDDNNAQTTLGSFTVDNSTDYSLYEISVDQDFVDKLQDSAYLNEWGKVNYNLFLIASGIDYEKTVFVPTPDAPTPEVDMDNAEADGKENEFTASKAYILDESDALSEGTFFSNDNHAFAQRKKKNKNWCTYRIIQRFNEDELQGARCFKLTVHSKNSDEYATYTLNTCFDYLNIDGYKIYAGDGYTFAALIIDNIDVNDELTFSNFEIVH